MDLEQKAIERIKMASVMSLRYYQKPLLVTYSGGKDSEVELEMVIRSEVPFEVQNSHTTADAPETVRHIKNKFYELELKGIKCTIDKPTFQGKSISMWSLIPIKLMPPTRVVRYCCQVLKETAGDGRMIATGVRWDESKKRADRGGIEAPGATSKKNIILTNDNNDQRRFFEKCEVRAKTVCNPIIEWTNSDIWEFIHSEKIEVNPLYQYGFNRVGCIGCPLAGNKRYFEFRIYPKYKDLYINAFNRMLVERKNRGKNRGKEDIWKTGEEVFLWWMEDKNVPGQIGIDEWLGV